MCRIVYQLLHLLHISCQFSLVVLMLWWCYSRNSILNTWSVFLFMVHSKFKYHLSPFFFFLETSAPIQNSFIFLPLKSSFCVLMSVLNALHSRVEEFHGGVHLYYKWFVKKYVYLTLDSNMNVLVVLAHRKLHK